MRSDGWNADYPDAENFMQLLYGPSGPDNNARFNLPEFNALYERARTLPDSPERTELFDRMTELVIAYAPWRMTYHLLEDNVRHPWVEHVRAASDPARRSGNTSTSIRRAARQAGSETSFGASETKRHRRQFVSDPTSFLGISYALALEVHRRCSRVSSSSIPLPRNSIRPFR